MHSGPRVLSHRPALSAAVVPGRVRLPQVVPGRRLELGCRSGGGNGAGVSWPEPTFEILDHEGQRYVSFEQTQEALNNAVAAMAQGREELTAMHEEVNQLRAKLADSEQEVQSMDSLKHMRDEAMIARDAAQRGERDAVSAAVDKLHNKMSQAYTDGKDRQLATMERKLSAAVSAAAAAQAAATENAATDETVIVDAIGNALQRVEASATNATRISKAQATAANAAAQAAFSAALQSNTQHQETAGIAQHLYDEALRAIARSEADNAESMALQTEVKKLRKEIRVVEQARDTAHASIAIVRAESAQQSLKAQADAEGRITEMYHSFESLKFSERESAREARDQAAGLARQVSEFEDRLKQHSTNEGDANEGKRLAEARAEAAESAAREHHATMEAAVKKSAALYQQEADAKAQQAVVRGQKDAHDKASSLLEEAKSDNEAMVKGHTSERDALQKAVDALQKENLYWKQRSERAESRTQALASDMRSVAQVLPANGNHLKLRLKSSEMQALIQHGPAALEEELEKQSKATPDHDTADDWLPPSQNWGENGDQ